MPRANRTIAHFAALAALLACAAESPDTGGGEAPDTPTARPLVVDAAAPPTGSVSMAAERAATPRQTDVAPQQTAHSPLVGNWHLRPAAPIRQGGPGIRLTLTIDSVRAERLYGRLAHFFAGNVGMDPSDYAPFVGSASEGEVAMRLEHRNPAAPALAFAGRVSGDTIALDTFVIGPDTLSRDADWILVRER
jgi:hypothetical protein